MTKQVTVAQWVKALRSGKYKQTNRMLIDDKKYCCIGVLGKLCGMSDSKLEQYNHKLNLQDFYKKNRTPEWYTVILGSKYAGFNDSGYSFEEIADEIEKDKDLEIK